MNILLLNAHSPRNAGDLAILDETLLYLQAAYPDATISVAINDPSDTLLPAGAEYLPSLTRWLVQLESDGRWRWRKWLAPILGSWLFTASLLFRFAKIRLQPPGYARQQLMRRYYEADVIAVIGGGHLYAPHSYNIAFLWLWVSLTCAILMGKPLLLLPQSFGPLPGALQQKLLCWLVNRSTFVAAREYRSVDLLASIGVRRRVFVLPDLAFSAREAPEPQACVELALVHIGASDKPLIGITLMDWGGQNNAFQQQNNYEDVIVELITHLHITYQARIILFAQCTGPTANQDDRIIARRVLERTRHLQVTFVDQALPPDMLKAMYRQLDFLVATRMHSAIFGLSVGTPTLVIGYLHKSVGIMEMLGLRRFVLDIQWLTSPETCATFDILWREKEAVRLLLAQRIPAVLATLQVLPQHLRANHESMLV